MRWLAVPVSLFLASLAHAQGTELDESLRRTFLGAVSAADYDSRALVLDEGILHATGSNFAARVSREELRFTALAGDDSQQLTLTVAGIGRDGKAGAIAPAISGVPNVDGLTARIARGSNVVEHLDVRQAGVKQSFVFAERPLGEGDLVIKLRIATDLELLPRDKNVDGLRFGTEGKPYIHIGAVLGIDAQGTKQAGWTEVDGDELRFVLPADFVESAKYPLELDPLIGSVMPLGSIGTTLLSPDIAYEPTNDRYLMVCTNAVVFDTGIVAFRFDGNLNPVGAPITLASPSFPGKGNAHVATVNSTDRFLVSWTESDFGIFAYDEINVRSVRSSDGTLSSEVRVSAAGINSDSAVVSGDLSSSASRSRAWVVYREGSNGIIAKHVIVPPNGNPLVATTHTLASGTNGSKPRISKSGGPNGVHMAVWQTDFGAHHDIDTAILNSSGALLASPFTLYGLSNVDETEPDVDGDGVNFLVSWRQVASGFNLKSLNARCWEWTGGAIIVASPVIELAADNAFARVGEPRIAFTGNRFLLAHVSEFTLGSNEQIYLFGLTPDTCESCAASQAVGDGLLQRDGLELASEWAGGATDSDRAVIVWQEQDAGGDRGVRGRLAEGIVGGSVVDMGGGCGFGGMLQSEDPYLGNSDYALRIVFADPGATTALINLNRNPLLFSCGGCFTNINLGILESIPLSNGSGELALPIPCSIQLFGFTTTAQGIAVLPTAISPCSQFANISATNRLELTIGH